MPPVVYTSQQAIAREYGVTQKQVSDWIVEGMPGKSGWFPSSQVREWVFENKFLKRPDVRRQFIEGIPEDDDVSLRLKEQKYRKGEIEMAEKIEMLIPREHAQQYFSRMAWHFKNLGELLLRDHGQAAQQLTFDTLDAVENEMKEMFT